MTPLRLLYLVATALLTLAPSVQADWPMLGHDAARTGATATEVRPPFERKWYRAFPDEGLMCGVQPIISDGVVYIGTLRGVLHAIDAETGQDKWTFRAGGPILHACAAAGGKVVFGCADGYVCAVNAADGKPAWGVQTGTAVWNAPAVYDGHVYVGSRSGRLFCIQLKDGWTRWESAALGGPILNSPAIDANAGRVYVGAEDMRVYAFDARNGDAIWTSDKLPGVSFRGYHPVVTPDGSVVVTTQPHAGGDAIQQVVMDMVKGVFGDFASWRHNKDENAKLREQNFKLMEKPETYQKQLDYLRKRLTDESAYQTFFVLDGKTGKQKFVAPIVYAESMNGTASSPIVTADGKVIVKYSSLLRSRYEHYSPFLNVGYLDTQTGHVTPVMDQTRTYGWHDSLLLVHDEQSQLSAGGKVLFNAHQDNVNGMDLATLKGFESPLAVNVHEAPPGAAVGVWANYLAGKPLPVGWEWFARGTAVYGGGSTIDVPVAIAGDSFYYLPTHEINSGCVLLAYRMKPDGKASRKAPQPAEKLTGEQWKQVQWAMNWDWDTLASPRLDVTLKGLPEPVAGTRQRPMTAQAKAIVQQVSETDLYDKFIRTGPAFKPRKGHSKLWAELELAVEELVSKQWRPLVLPAGKAPDQAHRVFNDPSETLYTLALAYPHLSPPLQERVRAHVAAMRADGGPLAGWVGRKTYDPAAGAARSAYDPAPDRLVRVNEQPTRSNLARLYPVYLWAEVTKEWGAVRLDWPKLKEFVAAPEGPGDDCGNGDFAGLIAACHIAERIQDWEDRPKLFKLAYVAMRQRLEYELAHTEGGLITVQGQRAVFGRWRNLTPDVARLLAHYAKDVEQHLMEVYVDYHRPTWWLAWNVELNWGNEVPTALPTHARDIFAARAMILGEPSPQLSKYVDIPWCKGDEYYIQKLALTLHEQAGTRW
jgi:outer membrane protein assembly factor BamB